MKIENEKVTTNDNFELDVVIKTPEEPYKKLIVMCHGLTSHKNADRNQLLELSDKLCESDYKVIQFDWRGHGESQGVDLDVSPTSFLTDLECIINNYCKDEDYYLFGFSFGGFAVNQYICEKNIRPDKIVLWGPALDPIGSSFDNPKTFCYQEIFDAKTSGSLKSDGYVYWESKDWKVSEKFIEECENYNSEKNIAYMKNLNILLLQGTNDKNVDREYNKFYSEKYNFEYTEFDASHSLFEELDKAILKTVEFFNE